MSLVEECSFRPYRRIDLSARFQIVEYLAATVNCLAVKQLLDEPKDKAGFALFYMSNNAILASIRPERPTIGKTPTVIREYRNDIEKVPDVNERGIVYRSGSLY